MLACAGDVPTLETARRRGAAARAPARAEGPGRQRRRPDAPAARQPSTRTACPTPSSTPCSPPTQPVIFAYHGYPWLIHRLTYRRTNHHNIHVRGYKEEGTTTTPFDMVMLNDLDRFHLVMDVIDRVPGLGERRPRLRQHDGRHSGCACAPTPARTARTRPRCATGPGRRRARSEPPMRVLVVNAGSSSLKLSLLDDADQTIASAELAAPQARIDEDELRDTLGAHGFGAADAVGHRIVHGGARFTEAVTIDAPVERALRELVDLAPLHQPTSLAALDAVSAVLPGLPAVACFDTSFHATIPEAAAHLRAAGRVARALGPAALRLPRPVARVGGTAGQRATRGRQLPPRRRRVAVRDPRRPLGRHDDGLHAAGGPGDGNALGQRRPRARPVAARARRPGRAELARRAGARVRLARAGGHRRHARDPRASDRPATGARSSVATSTSTACVPAIAAMAATLGGLDALAFTGGVGERAPEIRARAADGLGFLGVAIDPLANAAPSPTPTSRPRTPPSYPRHRRARGPRDRPPGAHAAERLRSAGFPQRRPHIRRMAAPAARA